MRVVWKWRKVQKQRSFKGKLIFKTTEARDIYISLPVLFYTLVATLPCANSIDLSRDKS